MREITNQKKINFAIVITVLANIIIVGAFGSILLRSITVEVYIDRWGGHLKVARTSNPKTMDPVDAWDSVSNDMLDQVVETLIAYDLSDPDLRLVGRLAESWYWPDNTTIEFKLRENVFFHDGSKFNADCVLHTITRINFFGNWSGTLDPATHTMAFPHSLYKFSDGTPIFNDTLSFATDDYNVTLVLNRPYGPVEGLLTYTASSIVHPESTPANQMLEIGRDLIIGTGPFKLVRYIPNSEIRFDRWERYWRTGVYWGEDIIYVYYREDVTANNAMLAGDIDWLGQGIAALKPDFEADPDITITGDGINDYINGPVYWYIGFNTENINQTWRKAICHAFNYSYLIHEIKEDTIVNANSLVPPGFPAHNSSVIGGTYNIPYARQIMQSMGYGYTDGVPWDIGTQVGVDFYPGTNESLWKWASFIPADGNFSSNTWDFGYKQYGHFIQLLIQRFTEDMDLIGISITPECLVWDPFNHKFNTRHIWFTGWGPDYFETFVMIEPLINPESTSNFGKINNTELNVLLAQATIEIYTPQRYQYYKKLQYLIHDKYYYHMPLFYDKIYFVHAENLKGFPYNPMRMLYLYPTYRG